MSKIVSFRYNLDKWKAQKSDRTPLATVANGPSSQHNFREQNHFQDDTSQYGFISSTPTKMVTFKFESRAKSRESNLSSPEKSRSIMKPLYRSRSITPPIMFERGNTPNIEDSLNAMSQYEEILITRVQTAETEWFEDLKLVAQRLHFLRESYKTIQSLRRKKDWGVKTNSDVLNGASNAAHSAGVDDVSQSTIASDLNGASNAAHSAGVDDVSQSTIASDLNVRAEILHHPQHSSVKLYTLKRQTLAQEELPMASLLLSENYGGSSPIGYGKVVSSYDPIDLLSTPKRASPLEEESALSEALASSRKGSNSNSNSITRSRGQATSYQYLLDDSAETSSPDSNN